MRVYIVHTDRNALAYTNLSTALRTVAFHHRFGGFPRRRVHLTSHNITDLAAAGIILASAR